MQLFFHFLLVFLTDLFIGLRSVSIVWPVVHGLLHQYHPWCSHRGSRSRSEVIPETRIFNWTGNKGIIISCSSFSVDCLINEWKLDLKKKINAFVHQVFSHRSIDWLVHHSVGRLLIGWLIYPFISLSIDWLVDYLVCRLLIDWLIDWYSPAVQYTQDSSIGALFFHC